MADLSKLTCREVRDRLEVADGRVVVLRVGRQYFVLVVVVRAGRPAWCPWAGRGSWAGLQEEVQRGFLPRV